MEIETAVAQNLRVTSKNAQLDASCKRILSEKIILANIMKSCLTEYKDCTVEEIAEKYIEGSPQVGEVLVEQDERGTAIQGMNTEDTSLTEGRVTYDVRFHALAPATDELIRLIINVEAQGKFDPKYPLIKRGVYYCSRMISAQHGTEFTNSHYENIKKVTSIWVCLNPSDDWKNTINCYRITEDHLIGKAKDDIRNYDLLSIIMVCLGNPDDCEGILRMLGVLFSKKLGAAEKKDILQNEFSIPMTQTIEREVSQMCNISEYIAEEALAKGRTEGEQIGIAKGRAAERAEAVRSLMKNTGWSLQQAMAALSIPEAEQKHYLEQLKS